MNVKRVLIYQHYSIKSRDL